MLLEAAVAATKSSYLQALTTAALSLPGIALGTSQNSSEIPLDYRYLVYSEDGLMSVNASYIDLGIPFDDENSLDLKIEYETISGASPIYTTPAPNNTIVQSTSGASITEQRTAASLRYQTELESGTLAITPAFSDENDYSSNSVTTEYQWAINKKNTTFSSGVGLSKDSVGATGQTLDEDKESASVFFGVTQVMNKNSLMQVNLSRAVETGYLSDPYKLALVESAIVQDNRPDRRELTALLVRHVQYFKNTPGSLNVSYRYFQDSWSIKAHTMEAAFNYEYGDSWLLTPNLRYYMQSKAYFYEPYFNQVRADGIYSSDYRLASFGSVLVGFKAEKKFNRRTKMNFNMDYYLRDGELKLVGDYSVDPSPLKSTSLSIGVRYLF